MVVAKVKSIDPAELLSERQIINANCECHARLKMTELNVERRTGHPSRVWLREPIVDGRDVDAVTDVCGVRRRLQGRDERMRKSSLLDSLIPTDARMENNKACIEAL